VYADTIASMTQPAPAPAPRRRAPAKP
jgi:hypothetical protein